MRRSRNMDRGGGTSRQNVSAGPLISDHIRDLDLELELLKRKREMLEQQTLYNPFRQETQQRNYNQQSYSYNENVGQGSSNRDFSQLYDDVPPQNRKSYPKKRPSDNSWQYDSYPKKSAGYGRGYSEPSPVQNRHSFSSASRSNKGYQARSPVGGRPSIGQRIANQKPQIPDRKFVPKNVTKPTTTSAPPNKIASQPVAERNRLVAVTMKSVAETEMNKLEANRLLPDTVPTPQMKGRMEMSLGAILSNVRDIYADSPDLMTLRTAPYQRIMKQVIRDRIRTALLGKIVGTTREIIQEYRDMFPKDTDRDVVNEAIKAIRPEREEKSVNSVATEKIDLIPKADEVFRENVLTLLNSHLREMFNKIEEIYNNEPPSKENDISNENLEAKVKTETLTDPNEQTNTEIPENNVGTSKKDVIITDDVKNVDKKSDVIDDGKSDYDQSKINAEINKIQEKELKAQGDAAAANLGITDQTEYKRLLSRVIKKYIPLIVKMVNTNKMYKESVRDLIASNKDKHLETNDGPGLEKEQKPAAIENIQTESSPGTSGMKKGLYPLPYYVKLMGKPQLPKKNLMQTFLDSFNPKSIKKHRSIYNLLFIGFTEKSDFDAIVKANGTVIGRNTLSIRICENKENKTSENSENNTSENVEDNANENAETNISENAEINIGENTETNVSESAETNISESAETNISENAETNISENAETNISENAETNISETAGTNISENAETNISENVETNITENAETNINENAEMNIVSNTDQNTEDLNSSKDDILGGDLNGQIDEILSAVNETDDSSNLDDINTDEIPQRDNIVDDGNKALEGNTNENDKAMTNVAHEENEKSESIEKQEVNSDLSNIKTDNKDDIEIKNETEMQNKEENELKNEKTDQVLPLTTPVRSTATRASTRLAANTSTPSSIRTRRASKLAQN